MDIELKIQNFPAQQKIFSDPHKTKIVVKGRRFGLTKGAANDLILCALQRKYKQALWVDTINSNIDRYIQRYFMPHLKKLPQSMYTWRKQDKIVEILDSYIDFRSADRPENIEGFGYDKYFLNEAGIILKDEYLWYNAIEPMLLEYNPPGVIGGTPKGGGKLFHTLATQAQSDDPKFKDYAYFHFTTFDNPFLNPKKIQEQIDKAPELVARQEYLGEFLEDQGAVFRGVKSVMTATPQKPVEGHLYVMGVDLAKVQDFTVITVYDRHTNSQVYQDRFQHLDWSYQKKKIIGIAKHYNNALCVIDATGLGDPIADDLIRAGLAVEPYKITNMSKKEMIEKLMIWIEQQKFRMLDIKETFNEFSTFTYDVSVTGNIRYSAPPGLHDDIVVAHALALTQLFEIYKKEVVKKSRIRQEMEKRAKMYDIEDYVPI